tara:strand:+ start:257 stop:481 length:225 start_codon:yes stop_codon:yes gene_type:complete
MSYNSQVSSFVVGDLVFFTGYEVDNPPLAHKIGIVIEIGPGTKPHKLYRVLWLYNGTKINVSGKHLELAYTKKV